LAALLLHLEQRSYVRFVQAAASRLKRFFVRVDAINLHRAWRWAGKTKFLIVSHGVIAALEGERAMHLHPPRLA